MFSNLSSSRFALVRALSSLVVGCVLTVTAFAAVLAN